MEYLEIPWQIGIFIVAGFLCIIGPVLTTLVNRKVESLYVSVWYMVAGLLWISLLFIVAKMPGVHTGVQPVSYTHLDVYKRQNIVAIDRWNVQRRGIHWEFSEAAFLRQCLGH